MADGAAAAGVSEIFDDAVLDLDFDIDVIAAARVMSVLMDGRAFDLAFVALILIVFEDEVSVELFEFHQSSYPMTFRTSLSFSRK